MHKGKIRVSKEFHDHQAMMRVLLDYVTVLEETEGETYWTLLCESERFEPVAEGEEMPHYSLNFHYDQYTQQVSLTDIDKYYA